MLNEQEEVYLKKQIKKINSIKDVDCRLMELIKIKEDVRNRFNEYLDDVFATVDLKKSKLIIE